MATPVNTSSNGVKKTPVKKVFVISPIGGKGSDTRANADRFLNFIVKMALPEPEYQVLRADEDDSAYAITDAMLSAILESDICVADITGRNPNVMYELALAHAADKKVVIMNSDDAAVPFDIKDQRVVPYGLMPEEVSEAIKGLRAKALHEPDGRLRSMLNPVSEAFRGWMDLQRVESAAGTEGEALTQIVASLERKVDKVLRSTSRREPSREPYGMPPSSHNTLAGSHLGSSSSKLRRSHGAELHEAVQEAEQILARLETVGEVFKQDRAIVAAVEERSILGQALVNEIMGSDNPFQELDELRSWIEWGKLMTTDPAEGAHQHFQAKFG